MDIANSDTLYQPMQKQFIDTVIKIRKNTEWQLEKSNSPHQLEWDRYTSCLEHLEQLSCHDSELSTFLQKISSCTNHSQLSPEILIQDWFTYYACLLQSYDQLNTSPMFKRFRINRYEMLTRFEEWIVQYQELASISNVKPDETLLAWPAFIEHFHIRKLMKYLAAFWVQWQGMRASDAKKILSMLGLRTKASIEELNNITLPYPPGFNPVSTIKVQSFTSQNKHDNQVLILFQPVFCNQKSQLHHCEAFIRPNRQKSASVTSVSHINSAMKVLAERLPHTDTPVAISISASALADSELKKQLDQIASQPDLCKKLIIQIDCTSLAEPARYLINALASLQEAGCQLILDNCGINQLPGKEILNLFSYLRPHPHLLHDSKEDLAARLILNELVQYASQTNLKVIAQHVDSAETEKHQNYLGFDLSQGNWLAEAALHPPVCDHFSQVKSTDSVLALALVNTS